MSLELAKEQRGYFLYRLFCLKEIFLTFAFYLNVYCIEYSLRIYILLLIKKHYFIRFCCLFLKSSKTFTLSRFLPNVPFSPENRKNEGKHQKTKGFMIFSGRPKGNTGKKNDNPFQANDLFLYPLKTSKNRRLSYMFSWYRNGALA